jgi:hypothetical protein
MERIISTVNLRGLKNETHVQFHKSVDDVFVKFNPDFLGINPLHGLYKKSLDNEDEALDFIKKSELTQKIYDQDNVRDVIYRGFVDSIKGEKNHFDPARREAANLLYNLTQHYGNIARKTLDDETAAIDDLVRNLNQPLYSQAIALLGLLAWQNKLVEENTKFTELMKERYTEISGKTSLRMRTSRRETDRFYHAIISQIENQNLAGVAVDEAFIRELNAVIDRFKHSLAKSKDSGSKGNSDKE